MADWAWCLWGVTIGYVLLGKWAPAIFSSRHDRLLEHIYYDKRVVESQLHISNDRFCRQKEELAREKRRADYHRERCRKLRRKLRDLQSRLPKSKNDDNEQEVTK